MPEHIQYKDDDLFNPETHHESSDVPVKGLLWFIVIFIVFSAISYAVIYFMYRGLAKMESKRMDPPATAVVRPATADIPQNQPLLQPFPREGVEPQHDTPVVDLVKLREREEKILGTYGWVDKQQGVVHIPIEEAKKRLAAQAVAPAPVPAETPAPVPAGSPVPEPAAPPGGSQ